GRSGPGDHASARNAVCIALRYGRRPLWRAVDGCLPARRLAMTIASTALQAHRWNPPRRVSYWIGWTLSGLPAAFLLVDAGMKLAALPIVLETSTPLGFGGVEMAHTLGFILLACTLLYLAPRTAVLGAILLTAYLGGAIATQVRVGN